jgi:hypothetical protein
MRDGPNKPAYLARVHGPRPAPGSRLPPRTIEIRKAEKVETMYGTEYVSGIFHQSSPGK